MSFVNDIIDIYGDLIKIKKSSLDIDSLLKELSDQDIDISSIQDMSINKLDTILIDDNEKLVGPFISSYMPFRDKDGDIVGRDLTINPEFRPSYELLRTGSGLNELEDDIENLKHGIEELFEEISHAVNRLKEEHPEIHDDSKRLAEFKFSLLIGRIPEMQMAYVKLKANDAYVKIYVINEKINLIKKITSDDANKMFFNYLLEHSGIGGFNHLNDYKLENHIEKINNNEDPIPNLLALYDKVANYNSKLMVNSDGVTIVENIYSTIQSYDVYEAWENFAVFNFPQILISKEFRSKNKIDLVRDSDVMGIQYVVMTKEYARKIKRNSLTNDVSFLFKNTINKKLKAFLRDHRKNIKFIERFGLNRDGTTTEALIREISSKPIFNKLISMRKKLNDLKLSHQNKTIQNILKEKSDEGKDIKVIEDYKIVRNEMNRKSSLFKYFDMGTITPLRQNYNLHITIDGLISDIGNQTTSTWNEKTLDFMVEYKKTKNKLYYLIALIIHEAYIINNFKSLLKESILQKNIEFLLKRVNELSDKEEEFLSNLNEFRNKDNDEIPDDKKYYFILNSLLMIAFITNNMEFFLTYHYYNNSSEIPATESMSYDDLMSNIRTDKINNFLFASKLEPLLKFKISISKEKNKLIDKLLPSYPKIGILKNLTNMCTYWNGHAVGSFFYYNETRSIPSTNFIDKLKNYDMHYVFLNSGEGSIDPIHLNEFDGSKGISIEFNSTGDNIYNNPIIEAMAVYTFIFGNASGERIYALLNSIERRTRIDSIFRGINKTINLVDRPYEIKNDMLYGDSQLSGTCTMHAPLMMLMCLAIKCDLVPVFEELYTKIKRRRIDMMLNEMAKEDADMTSLNILVSLKLKGFDVYGIGIEHLLTMFPDNNFNINNNLHKIDNLIISRDIEFEDRPIRTKADLEYFLNKITDISNGTQKYYMIKILDKILELPDDNPVFLDTKYLYTKLEEKITLRQYKNYNEKRIKDKKNIIYLSSMYFNIKNGTIDKYFNTFFDTREINTKDQRMDFIKARRTTNNQNKYNICNFLLNQFQVKIGLSYGNHPVHHILNDIDLVLFARKYASLDKETSRSIIEILKPRENSNINQISVNSTEVSTSPATKQINLNINLTKQMVDSGTETLEKLYVMNLSDEKKSGQAVSLFRKLNFYYDLLISIMESMSSDLILNSFNEMRNKIQLTLDSELILNKDYEKICEKYDKLFNFYGSQMEQNEFIFFINLFNNEPIVVLNDKFKSELLLQSKFFYKLYDHGFLHRKLTRYMLINNPKCHYGNAQSLNLKLLFNKEKIDIKLNKVDKLDENVFIVLINLLILTGYEIEEKYKQKIINRSSKFNKYRSNELPLTLIRRYFLNGPPPLLSASMFDGNHQFIEIYIDNKTISEIYFACMGDNNITIRQRLINNEIVEERDDGNIYWRDIRVEVIDKFNKIPKDTFYLQKVNDRKIIQGFYNDPNFYLTSFEIDGAINLNNLYEFAYGYKRRKFDYLLDKLNDVYSFIFYKKDRLIVGYDPDKKVSIEIDELNEIIKYRGLTIKLKNLSPIEKLISYGHNIFCTNKGYVAFNFDISSVEQVDPSISLLFGNLFDTKRHHNIFFDKKRDKEFFKFNISNDLTRIDITDLGDLLHLYYISVINGNSILINILIKKIFMVYKNNDICHYIKNINTSNIVSIKYFNIPSFVGIIAGLASEKKFGSQNLFKNLVSNKNALLRIFPTGNKFENYFEVTDESLVFDKDIGFTYDFNLLNDLKEIFEGFITLRKKSEAEIATIEDLSEKEYAKTKILCTPLDTANPIIRKQLFNGVPVELINDTIDQLNITMSSKIFNNMMNGDGYTSGLLENLELSQKILELNTLLVASKKLQQAELQPEYCYPLNEVHSLVDTDQLFINYDKKTQLICVFEHLFGYITKNRQIDFLVSLLNNRTNQYSINQLLMGMGKTSVITPLLILYYQSKTNFMFGKSADGEIIVEDVPSPNKNIVLCLPDHLMQQTNSLLTRNYYIMMGNIGFLYKLDSDKSMELVRAGFKTNVTIIDDNSLKLSYLNSKINERNFDIRDRLIIFDECDLLYNPLSSELNIPDVSEDKIIIENGIPGVDFVYSIATDLVSKLKSGAVEEKDLLEMANINRIIDIIIEESITASTIFTGFTASPDASNPYSIARYGFIKTLKYYAKIIAKMTFGKDYGFSNHNDVLMAIPYSAVDKPAEGSRFSNSIMILVATCFSFAFSLIPKSKLSFIFKIIHSTLIEKAKTFSIAMLRSENPIESKIRVEDILSSYSDSLEMFLDIPDIEKDNYLINWLLKGYILHKELAYHDHQFNTSFMQLIHNNFSHQKIAFTGSVELRLPEYEDKTHHITSIVKDNYSNGAVRLNIKGSPEFRTYSFKITELNDIVKAMYEMDYNVLIDGGGLFKKYKIEDMIKLIYNELKRLDIGNSKKLHERKIIFPDNKNILKEFYNGKIKDYSFTIYNQDEVIMIYDNKHIVGIDIPQPFGLRGLCTLNGKSRYTDISQAIFRLRKLGYGATINFCHYDYLLEDIDSITYAERLALYETPESDGSYTEKSKLLEKLINNERNFVNNSELSRITQNYKAINTAMATDGAKFRQKVFIEEFTELIDTPKTLLMKYYKENVCDMDSATDTTLLGRLCLQIRELLLVSRVVHAVSTQIELENEEEEKEEEHEEERHIINKFDRRNQNKIIMSIDTFVANLKNFITFRTDEEASRGVKKISLHFNPLEEELEKLRNSLSKSVKAKFVYNKDLELNKIVNYLNLIHNKKTKLLISPEIFKLLFSGKIPMFRFETSRKKVFMFPSRDSNKEELIFNDNHNTIHIVKVIEFGETKYLVVLGPELLTIMHKFGSNIENIFTTKGKSILQKDAKKIEQLHSNIFCHISILFNLQQDLTDILSSVKYIKHSQEIMEYLRHPDINKFALLAGGDFNKNSHLNKLLKDSDYDFDRIIEFLRSGTERKQFIRDYYNTNSLTDSQIDEVLRKIIRLVS